MSCSDNEWVYPLASKLQGVTGSATPALGLQMCATMDTWALRSELRFMLPEHALDWDFSPALPIFSLFSLNLELVTLVRLVGQWAHRILSTSPPLLLKYITWLLNDFMGAGHLRTQVFIPAWQPLYWVTHIPGSIFFFFLNSCVKMKPRALRVLTKNSIPGLICSCLLTGCEAIQLFCFFISQFSLCFSVNLHISPPSSSSLTHCGLIGLTLHSSGLSLGSLHMGTVWLLH